MSWRKDKRGEPDPPRGYHHGNLREALIRAALELIATKGTAGFTFAEAARFAGVSPAAPYRHFRDRDELMASVALRGFEQFEAALARALGRRAPRRLHGAGSARQGLSRLRPRRAGVLLGNVRSRRSGRRKRRRCERRANALSPCCAAPPMRSAPRCPLAGRPPALMVALHIWTHGAWRRFALRTRRWRAARAADVCGGTPGGAGAGLFARARGQRGAAVSARLARSNHGAQPQRDLTTALRCRSKCSLHSHERMPCLSFLRSWGSCGGGRSACVLLGLFLGRGKFGCRRPLSYAGDAPMFDGDHGRDRWERKMTRLQEKMEMVRAKADRFRGAGEWFGPATSGNRAFDDYRSETLKRLEDEQQRVQGFPRPAALRQGSLRVRPVHGRAAQSPLRAGIAVRAGAVARLTLTELPRAS